MEQKGMRRYVCKKALIGINFSVQWEPLKVFEQVKKLANIMCPDFTVSDWHWEWFQVET